MDHGKNTQEAIAHQFATDGYVTGLPGLTQKEVVDCRNRIDAFRQARPNDVAWAFDIKCNLLFDWVYRLCCHQALIDAVTPMTGDSIYVTNATFRIKHPHSAQAYGWHQDSARVQVDPCFVIVFLALSEQTTENGCLEVIPGSHTQVHPFQIIENRDGQDRRRVARTDNVNTSNAVPLELAPGELAVFSGNLVHGSGPNQSDNERVSLLIDYTPVRSKQNIGQGSGQLVKGHDPYGYIAQETVPAGNCLDVDVINRRETLSKWPENPLMGPLGKDGVISFPDSGTIGF